MDKKTKLEKIIEKVGGEPILIKAGDIRVKLGIPGTSPNVDIRVLSEGMYQAMVKLINQLENENG